MTSGGNLGPAQIIGAMAPMRPIETPLSNGTNTNHL